MIDDEPGMQWWNELSVQQQFWLDHADTAVAADAW